MADVEDYKLRILARAKPRFKAIERHNAVQLTAQFPSGTINNWQQVPSPLYQHSGQHQHIRKPASICWGTGTKTAERRGVEFCDVV